MKITLQNLETIHDYSDFIIFQTLFEMSGKLINTSFNSL